MTSLLMKIESQTTPFNYLLKLLYKNLLYIPRARIFTFAANNSFKIAQSLKINVSCAPPRGMDPVFRFMHFGNTGPVTFFVVDTLLEVTVGP